MARDIRRFASGDQCLQLAVKLLVGRFFYLDLDVRMFLLEVGNQLLNKRAVLGIDSVVCDRYLFPGAAVVCCTISSFSHIARRFASAAAG
ncbi:hypothetical protein D3C73_1442120 [compost metagenome]